MSSWHRLEKGMRNQDTEGQLSKTDGDNSGRIKTIKNKILVPEGRMLNSWNMMFAVSCVIAVSVDPLFFYLPIIGRDKTCLSLDKRLKITAYTLRSITDLIYLLNIVLQFLCPYVDEDYRKLGRRKVVTNARDIAKRYVLSGYFLIDVLAILPLPQVVLPIIFSEMKDSKFLDKRKWLNAVVFFQYVPRVLRIYISWMDHSKTSKIARIVWVKAAFNFFLYILASHVLGALWYLFSIQRKTACWHIACEKIGCTSTSFNCKQPLSDHIFLKDHCSEETPNTTSFDLGTPNTTRFDFGIFLVALQSGNLESTDFSRKLSYCFWWGLRNLSSFGQNLQTSTYFWENCFAIFVSIFALMLFLYFIGNVQAYMQLATERSEEIIQKMNFKKREIDIWIARNKLPVSMKHEIFVNVQSMLEENKDVDVQNLLSHLRIGLVRDIKRYICLPMLKKVPQLEGESDQLLQSICEYLKPMQYNQHSYIVREGEPLDAMLFITQGIIWNFSTSNAKRSAKCIGQGSFYGEELLDWGLERDTLPNLSNLPISPKTAKTHTKVEAFALMANDLWTLVSRRTETAPFLIQAAFRRYTQKRNAQSHPQAVEEKKNIEMSSFLLTRGDRS